MTFYTTGSYCIPLFLNYVVFLFQTIKNKYSTSKQAKISTLAQLNSALVQDLAKAVAKV